MKTKNILRHELTGLNIKIIDSKNKYNTGITGTIIDETKETLVIKQKNTKKRLFKKNITFQTKINNQMATIKGEKLIDKPFKRIKK